MDKRKIFILGDLVVKPGFLRGWEKEFEEADLIFVQKGDDENLSLSLDEAKFIIDSFNEIIEHYKNMPKIKIDTHVNIINGRFKGCRGRVTDIDVVDKERPVMVRIDTLDFEGYCFVNYDDVEDIMTKV